MSFTYYRTVRFQDTDSAGVVYFANILKICHEAYEESLEVSGINLKYFFLNPKIAYPIIHANIDFFKPIYCGDKLEVQLIPQKVTNEKFEISYEIFIADVIVSKAMTRHASIDIVTRQKREISDEIDRWIQVLNQR
ncbi:acyl-CoA thioesterase [Brunnivagina elsteri]|uniref:1,4-dihydroxy-2-naphthoyl-CoA hydrolase n=1 Tax=Brunnivagina elsteri CCALA 953 TaxID=987040 RepID=A0A2A2TP96_9CYAN|nr:thioesterase family protein [Calothrix elsteri]PAX60270.1 1,4-dihydroxy-2-naphthoyl-CoA hydrolase [Calothrix elsteri CCALA 953]